MKIVYLGYYSSEKNRRDCSPAAVTMMQYVAGAIKKSNNEVIIISPAQSEKVYGEVSEIQNNIKVIYLPSHGNIKGLLQRSMNYLKRKQELYNALETYVSEDTTLIVYHSLAYIDVLKRLQKKKKIRLILQVNEIYSDIIGSVNAKINEIQWFDMADGYIFSTELLAKKIDCKNKKYCICLGTYKEEKFILKREKGKNIHVIYGGTFDVLKGGETAISVARYLPSTYYLHICGFGNEIQIKNIKDKIAEVKKENCCKIIYEGCLLGDKYIRMLQNCDIGLSTQNPEAKYNNTSFPSKILSYMSNGLQVVSIRIPAIETSAVGKYMYYYDEPSPKVIADTIMRINWSHCKDMRKVIQELDEEFCNNIIEVLRV